VPKIGKMKLSVASPGHAEALKAILKSTKGMVCEVFISSSSEFIGSIRSILGADANYIEELAAQVELAHKHGVSVNVVANTTCLGGYHLTREGQNAVKWYLKKLEEVGVDSVTVTDPFFLEMVVENYDMEVAVSCLAHVDSVERALFFEELGAKYITLDTNINRDFETLEKIREATSCELKLIVNESCIWKCPFRYQHANLTSHFYGVDRKVGMLSDYYHDRCATMRVRNPTLIIKSPWIRPEDLKEYEKIGIHFFKIAGRTQPVNWIVRALRAYEERSFDGNLLELLDVTRELRDLFYVPNKELEGAIEKWKYCSRNCKECGFCEELTMRVFRVWAHKGTEKERLLPLSEFRNLRK